YKTCTVSLSGEAKKRGRGTDLTKSAEKPCLDHLAIWIQRLYIVCSLRELVLGTK
ncbi:Uncharacterized protein APZ42_007359, partial [Daphnia magna]